MNSHQFLKAVLIAVALAGLMALFLKPPMDQRGGLAPGAKAPVIRVAGWLNGPGPEPDALQGEIVVVQGWFTSCIYCRRETPELAATFEKFRDRGVKFISLTFETDERLEAIEAFVSQTGMTWPAGYGAIETLQQFDAEYFPCVWIIDRDGTVVWNRDSRESLEEALERTLENGNPS